MGGKNIHWVVALDRRNRTVSFALSLAVIGSYLQVAGSAPWQWALLSVHLLVYPQLAYWRAIRAAHPVRAEMQNLLLDGVLFGAWCAYWGMPLWLCFLFFICVCLNMMVFQGLPGLFRALAALGIGVAAVLPFHGFAFRPDTPLLTSLLCIGLLTTYLLTFAFGAYQRGVALKDIGGQLRTQLQEITQLQARLQEQAARDPLTGLFNRRHFDRELAEALERCRHEGRPLALAIADIDRFKAINDNHGHLAGDEVLRRLSELLVSRVGDAGLACRFGGEEFLLMLPGMDADAACAFAETLRGEFQALRIVVDGREIGTTLSFGVAAAPLHATDGQTLLRRADAALYAAKLHGRNRVESSSPAGESVAQAS